MLSSEKKKTVRGEPGPVEGTWIPFESAAGLRAGIGGRSRSGGDGRSRIEGGSVDPEIP